jgi:hypothetical protein
VQLALENGEQIDDFTVGGSPETVTVTREPDHVWVGGGDGGRLIQITPPAG